MKDKYKVIRCFLVWNDEDDCPASEPLWSERSAQEFADDMNKGLRDIITSRERFFSVARKHYRGDEDIEVVIKGMVENAYI